MVATTVPAEKSEGPLGRLMDMGLENYKWSKDLVTNNKTLGPRLSPVVNFAEETTVSVLKKSPIQVDDVVTAVDTRVNKAVSYGSETIQKVVETPTKWKDGTLGFVHGKLQSLRVDGAEEEDTEPAGVRTVLVDAKSVIAERTNLLLDASEGYLQQYLPPTEEDEDLVVEGEKCEIRPTANRAFKLSKVAAKRMQERALAKAGNLKRRTQDVVHVDLVKYSEWLDKQKTGAKDFVSVRIEVLDEKVVQPTKAAVSKRVEKVAELASNGAEAVKTRVVLPAKERILAINFPFQDKVIRVWTVVSDKYNEKLVQPRDQIITMFREELAAQQKIAKEKNGDKEMTISAGLAAVVAAARERLSQEWEVRVSPSVARFMGREAAPTEEDEFEEDKSFGDEAEEDLEESE